MKTHSMQTADLYRRSFSSLDQMLDHYYDHDLFNVSTVQVSRPRKWAEKKSKKILDFYYDL